MPCVKVTGRKNTGENDGHFVFVRGQLLPPIFQSVDNEKLFMSPIGDDKNGVHSAVSGMGFSPVVFSRNSKDFRKFSAIPYKDFHLQQVEANGQPGFRFSGTGPVRKSGRA